MKKNLIVVVTHCISIFWADSLLTSSTRRDRITKGHESTDYVWVNGWDPSYDSFKYSENDPLYLECKAKVKNADFNGDERLNRLEYVSFIFASVDAESPDDYSFIDLPLSLIAVFNLAVNSSAETSHAINLTDEKVVLDLCSRVDSRIEDFIPHPSSTPTINPSATPSKMKSSNPSSMPTIQATSSPSTYPSHHFSSIPTSSYGPSPNLSLSSKPSSRPSLMISNYPLDPRSPSLAPSSLVTTKTIAIRVPFRFPLSTANSIGVTDILQENNNTVILDLTSMLLESAIETASSYETSCRSNPKILNDTSVTIDEIQDVACDIDDYLYSQAIDVSCSVVSSSILFEAYCLSDAIMFKEALTNSIKTLLSNQTTPC